MKKTNMEIFKQALEDAVSCQFDELAAACDDEIVFSERHLLAMRAILYGKADKIRTRPYGMKRVIAILIAAALLLASCGIVFHNEIREVFEEFFVKLTYDGAEESNKTIKDIYILGYVPDGYVLEEENLTSVYVKYEYVGKNEESLCFEQRALTPSSYYINSENGYSQMKEIDDYEVYYRFTKKYHHYIYQIDNYSMTIKSSVELSRDELVLMIDKIEIK